METYAYVENIRKYQISLVGYLQEKEKQATEAAMQLAQDYPAVSPTELGKEKFPFLSFLSQSSSNYLTHSPSLLFSRKGVKRNKINPSRIALFLRFNFWRRMRKKSLSNAAHSSASIPSVISTR